MSDQSIYDFLNTPGNMSAMNYGLELDPSLQGDPYKQLGWQTDAIKALGSIGGLYPEDLLGLPEAPQMPDWTPYQSDYLAVMGNNPVVQAAAQGVAQGVNPVAAAKEAIAAAKEQGYDTAGMDTNWVSEQALQFATETAKQSRDQGRFQQEMSAYQGYDQPTPLYQDVPTVDDLIQQYAGNIKYQNVKPMDLGGMADRARANSAPRQEPSGQSGSGFSGWLDKNIGNPIEDWVSNTFGSPTVGMGQIAPDEAGGRIPYPTIRGSQRTAQGSFNPPTAAAPTAQGGGGGQMANYRGGLGGLADRARDLVSSTPRGAGVVRPSTQSMDPLDVETKQMLEKSARAAQERMRSAAGPSQREMQNRARVALMWQMAAGMPAPR